jgi:DNA topoisomerase-1
VTDSSDTEIHYAASEERALTWLDREAGKPITPASTPRRGTPLTKPANKMHPATDEERKRLRIPPAWTEVYIADDPDAALVAKGKDVKGRTQSIYSAQHSANQAEKKFARIRVLAKHLPELDARLEKDAMTNDHAAALLLIRKMGMRPGSNKDTGADKEAFGATNLQAKHVRVTEAGTTIFEFTGKKGVDLKLSTNDPFVAQVIRKRKRTRSRNQPLFDTSDAQTRAYMQSIVPGEFYLKDMRTLHANVIALEEVAKIKRPPKTMTEFRRRRNEVADKVSAQLGNTRTMALSSYINPTVFAKWEAEL